MRVETVAILQCIIQNGPIGHSEIQQGTGASFKEPITRSEQLPYSVCATAFSQVGLFLDKPFPRISFQKPIRSECIINNNLLMRNY